jgi:mRNA-degrading endonuclease RelE of RelBE toxin-antitoxin system
VPEAKFQLRLSDEALDQLRALPKVLRRRIGDRLTALETAFSGDVKKLAGSETKYRLRVGNYRILFRLVRNEIHVYRVSDRKNAYE